MIATATFRDTLRDLDALIEQRFISVREHPAAPLFIYNYTAKAQFERGWHETTKVCRGLILDAEGNLVQRPFPKFFNLGEYDGEEYTCCQPEVWHKYDGSLGILYWVGDRPAIASRGSFVSEQALRATAMLEDQYRDSWPYLDKRKTYLFEIVYPENRIVVDYGDTEELRLLTVIDTATGEEFGPYRSLGFPAAEMAAPHIGALDPYEMQDLNEANSEGFVLFWRDHGLRLKVKFADYLRVHRIVTGLSMKQVWEALRDGEHHVLATALSTCPDVFKQWLTVAMQELTSQYETIEDECREALTGLHLLPIETRKTQADYITQQKYPAVLFKMLDGRDYAPVIWKMLKPGRGFETFRKDDE